jgi:hypothetical protein
MQMRLPIMILRLIIVLRTRRWNLHMHSELRSCGPEGNGKVGAALLLYSSQTFYAIKRKSGTRTSEGSSELLVLRRRS